MDEFKFLDKYFNETNSIFEQVKLSKKKITHTHFLIF
jgi:hypothetical protein